ncbi:type I-E CRISPR-associated protein Cas6/Cse3/CasE [Thioclava sp. JE_KL1]|uniref:type I-E CRISPR-associated protein Cas6/Cse3/CasE n=1 Tax=Thioclava sp. JE_KL1 TaxID=2651187 RepID=UPI0010682E08|nr:type I-E CRISPR-associated protein Cas6/Cse3/CasE [Thioclava sp. JE_KL1]MPQ95449.1 type I-E CRISPR-associated protein Cas6/Cse3/CasE [Thioclava sp. JE_KL1]
MSMYLSRIRLSRSPSVQALGPLLVPNDMSNRRSADHNLLWSVFADGPERRRDFLWRAEPDGSYLTLSARTPKQLDLFEPHDIKEFAPSLAPGDKLSFLLRANATRMKRGGKRADVVMDALHDLPPSARAQARMEIAQREGARWLERQGDKAGFRLIGATIQDYSTETLSDPRARRAGALRLGILDITGQLEVSEPVAFIAQLGQGFGRAKAFGCGLMLIRRAR